MYQHSGCGRVGERRHRREGFDVHVHVLGRVDRSRERVSENRRYWFAHETHHDAGQYRADHPLVGHRHGR